MLAIALQGVRGHGHDGKVPQPGVLADQRNRFQTSKIGHLNIHENEVEGGGVGFKRVERFAAVVDDPDQMPSLFQQPSRQNLIDAVVLRQEQTQRPHPFADGPRGQ